MVFVRVRSGLWSGRKPAPGSTQGASWVTRARQRHRQRLNERSGLPRVASLLMAIITDLNQRERAKYAEAMDGMAEAARSLAAALRDVNLVPLALTSGAVHDLLGIFKSATSAEVPDHPPVTGEQKAS